jgi:hypothetical protein
MPTDWSKVNDKYAIHIYEALDAFGSKPVSTEPELGMRGETENHTEERLAGFYGLSPASGRARVKFWYGDGLKQRGNRGGELIFPVSHESHYSAARGPILLFSMKAGHDDVTDVMVDVWKSDFATFALLADPGMTNYAACCNRLLDNADQRPQLIATINWLMGRKIHMPKTLDIAPDWLGLHSLMLIDKAHSDGERWASKWPDIKASIVAAKREDILPVKFGVTVEKSSQGHVAYFDNPDHFNNSAGKWALMRYANPAAVVYGVDDPTMQNNIPGTSLAPVAHRPQCPGGASEVYKFKIAGMK